MGNLWQRFRTKAVEAQEAPHQSVVAYIRPVVAFVRRHPIPFVATAAILTVLVVAFAYQYTKYAKLIDHKFGGGVIRTNSSVYAMPRAIAKGDPMTAQELIGRLQRAGYTEDTANQLGYYKRTNEGILIVTGPTSYFQPHSALVQIGADRIDSIQSRNENRLVDHLWLEPELVTNLFDSDREKRRPVTYADIPKHVIDALVSVEDKRFFKHTGLDVIRLAKAAYVDLKEGRKEQGASTITMQLARSFWLDQDKTFKRKMAEAMLTIELEQRFTKQQILELYVNEVYLGRRGSFSIHGFGEASRAYFGKDIRKLTVPEAAMLVGIIQRPSYYNPFRYTDRVRERRNLVLQLMRTNGYLDEQQYAEAANTPLLITPGETESSDAPYFVDLVNDDLQSRFQDQEFATNSYRVYSTLDLELQKAAVESVRESIGQLDQQLRRMRGKKAEGKFPQVALVALDPYTGDVRALVGGRSYTDSQLNRSLAKRQPGSAFKPFVYATAIDRSITGRGDVITAASHFIDEPTSFTFNRQVYEPANFHDEYHGDVSLRDALAKSMNIPTIKVAEKVGYERVAQIVREAGVRSPVMGTPSLALGSYEVTPLELAEAYTIFANKGVHVQRCFVTSIRDRRNNLVYSNQPQGNQVLDERAAFIMTNLMEEVVRSGTGAGARARGLAIPIAGKTGTSRDGWFAGYSSKLLAVVWVGYDDNTELELEAAKSALPLWANFMKRAHTLKTYSKPKPFQAPKGVISVDIDPETGMLPGPDCPTTRSEYFIAGTEPQTTCDHLNMVDPLADDEDHPDQVTKSKGKNIFKSVLGIFH